MAPLRPARQRGFAGRAETGANEFVLNLFTQGGLSEPPLRWDFNFLWIYTGLPASSYEGISIEAVRERCGQNLAAGDKIKADFVTGIPDSGVAHALGYAMASGLPCRRSLIKYTDGYGRSYTPISQKLRNKIAQMKLIPVKEVIQDKKNCYL